MAISKQPRLWFMNNGQYICLNQKWLYVLFCCLKLFGSQGLNASIYFNSDNFTNNAFLADGHCHSFECLWMGLYFVRWQWRMPQLWVTSYYIIFVIAIKFPIFHKRNDLAISRLDILPLSFSWKWCKLVQAACVFNLLCYTGLTMELHFAILYTRIKTVCHTV